MGPQKTPQEATENKAEKDRYCYRICRRGETPWTLRQPPDLTGASFAEKRSLMATGIAMGNETPSSFLHATTSLTKVMLVFGERRTLYSHWLVRWPKDIPGVECANFADKAADRQRWLSEVDGDTALIERCIKTARSYVQKDKEIVFLQHPGQSNVGWWDADTKTWWSSKWVHPQLRLDQGSEDTAPSQLKATATARSASVGQVAIGSMYWVLRTTSPATTPTPPPECNMME